MQSPSLSMIFCFGLSLPFRICQYFALRLLYNDKYHKSMHMFKVAAVVHLHHVAFYIMHNPKITKGRKSKKEKMKYFISLFTFYNPG